MEKTYIFYKGKTKYFIVWRVALDGKVWARILKKYADGEGVEFGKFKTKKLAVNYLKKYIL